MESVHPMMPYSQLNGSKMVALGSNVSADGSKQPLLLSRRRPADAHKSSQLHPSLNVAAALKLTLLGSTHPGMLHQPLRTLNSGR